MSQPQPARAHILVSEWMDAPAVDRLRSAHTLVYSPNLGVDRDGLLKSVGLIDALIVRNRTQVDEELLSAAPALRVVGRLGVGLDNIDVRACNERGVRVIPAIGTNARSVAEYVLLASMLLMRRVSTSTTAVAAGEWPRAALMQGREIDGQTLGIIGYGSIGRCTAELASRAGMRVIHWSNSPKDGGEAGRVEGLQALLRQSDVVSIHVPLTPQTRGLIGPQELDAMRDGAVIVNTARGGIVDERALVAALHAGRIGGAAIDVFEDEPLPKGSAWNNCPNVLLTPHIAGLTRESNQRVSDFIAEHVTRALAEPKPLEAISP